MRFKALACDYDGTLAAHDRIGADVLAALGAARDAGIRLILATGRPFFELTRVCERLDLFDAVVAENGAVIYVPSAGTIRDQGPPPPPRLLAELDRRGIYYKVGRVIIGAARADEGRVRDALAAVGVSLDLIYNRGALMLLPAGISKGTGVTRVIRGLGLSFHDVLALGDSENDVELFEACGWRAGPANSVPEVAALADWIFPGDDGSSIAGAITGPILHGRLPVARSPRHRVEAGWAVGSAEPVTIPARGVNVLIAGEPLSGKSWLAGALVERLADKRYAVCVIDPEGDYRVLERLPGVTWTEIRTKGSTERALAGFDGDPSACVVMDLSMLPYGSKVEIVEAALRGIRESRRRSGLPHWVVLDEAHYSLHRGGVAEEAVGLGDKGFCLATYRPSWLRPSLLGAVDVLVLARTTAREETALVRSLLSEAALGERIASVLPGLPDGEFVLVRPDEAGEWEAVTFVATPRVTPHVRHLKKYADSTVAPESRFFFRLPDGALVAAADSLGAFRRATTEVDGEVLAWHAARGDFSRWVGEVFSDHALAAQLRKTESRWSRGEIADLRRAIEALIASRYGARE